MNESKFPRSYTAVLERLRGRLRESAPGLIQILSGPRQAGKTTLLLELAREFGESALYAAADTSGAALPGWWEELGQRAERLAASRTAMLLVDEIQYLPDWGRRLKALADRIRRDRIPLHVAAAGSSSLRVGAGARESMAGRFERLTLSHWPARELATRFALPSLEAVRQLVRSGSYPGSMAFRDDPARLRAWLRDAIVEPAVGRDVLLVEAVRKPALLRQLFALAAAHPAEIVSLQKLCARLSGGGALETAAHYLHLLEEAFLVAAVPKYSERALRRRASPPKLVVLNQGLLWADPPATPEAAPDLWGRRVENACLAHAWNAGQEVTYWRAEPFEVDGIFEGSWGRWAVEVKAGGYGTADLSGLLEFVRRHRGFRPLVLCDRGAERAGRDAGVEVLPWEDFLLEGPA
jgi:hypothetical protein